MRRGGRRRRTDHALSSTARLTSAADTLEDVADDEARPRARRCRSSTICTNSSRITAISPCSSSSRWRAPACRCRAKRRWSAPRFSPARARSTSLASSRCAAAAAILGDNCGYWVGREFGFPLVYRYGRYIRVDEGRLKVAQYLFLRHGGKIVFFGRFVAVLRAFAAFLAGRQSAAMAAIPRCSTRWAASSGRRIFGARRLFPRPRLRALRAAGRHRGADLRGHRRRAREPLHRPSRGGAARRSGGGDAGAAGRAEAALNRATYPQVRSTAYTQLRPRVAPLSSRAPAAASARSRGPIHSRSRSERRRKSTLTARLILSASSARTDRRRR